MKPHWCCNSMLSLNVVDLGSEPQWGKSDYKISIGDLSAKHAG